MMSQNISKEDALKKINTVISNGQAAEKFEKMVHALGGPSDIMSSHENHLKIKAIKKDKQISALRNKKYPKGIKNFDQYLQRIEEVLSGISHHFYSGIGIKLQSKDSAIAADVILRMIKDYGVICLPVHDSFIVEDEQTDNLYGVMESEFLKHTGATCEIKVSIDKVDLTQD